MMELSKMIVNGQAYALRDDSKIPAPTKVQVGQTMVVAAVDDEGRPTAWTPGGVVVAAFDARDEDGEVYLSHTHTAAQLMTLLRAGNVVVAALRDQATDNVKYTLCFVEGSRLVLGDCILDGGWQHCVGVSAYYADGDSDRRETGNELWGAY